MAFSPKAKKVLLNLIQAQEELPIKRIPAIMGGQEPESVSVLYRPCTPIETTEEGLREAREIVGKMGKILKRFREITSTGRALAANQIGILKRVVVFLHPDGTFLSYINPEISWKSQGKNIYWEMCMSGTPLGVDVIRPARVKVRWYDLGGRQYEKLMERFDARRMQHEIDHLNGKTCYNTEGTVFSTLGYGLDPKVYMNQELRPFKK